MTYTIHTIFNKKLAAGYDNGICNFEGHPRFQNHDFIVTKTVLH